MRNCLENSGDTARKILTPPWAAVEWSRRLILPKSSRINTLRNVDNC